MQGKEFTPGTEVTTATENAAAKIPPALQWLRGTDPRIFTPNTYAHGGMSRILFADPEQGVIVSVYRSVGKCLDGATLVQDEVKQPFKKTMQLNYEISEKGEMARYPDASTLAGEMQTCIDAIVPLVNKTGSLIIATDLEKNTESTFLSDGEKWVEVTPNPQLEDGHSFLKGSIE